MQQVTDINSLIISHFIASLFILQNLTEKGQSDFLRTSSCLRNDSIPAWVKQLYEKHDTSQFEIKVNKVIFFKPLTDSTSYSLFTVSTGTCVSAYVATQKNKKDYASLEIQEECDADLSYPSYSWTSYTHNTIRRRISITTDTKEANPKYLKKDGNFRDGFDMDNVKTIRHVTRKTIVIMKSGNLEIQKKNTR
ncbi:MAG TPA: hypothetical protein VKR32_20295 [Puia sp.]|nr:hypothetical protein [Puia sp.]